MMTCQPGIKHLINRLFSPNMEPILFLGSTWWVSYGQFSWYFELGHQEVKTFQLGMKSLSNHLSKPNIELIPFQGSRWQLSCKHFLVTLTRVIKKLWPFNLASNIQQTCYSNRIWSRYYSWVPQSKYLSCKSFLILYLIQAITQEITYN